jgi:ubiquinone/menaquinone biosynthesis C-methylase UbiE
LDIPVEKMSNLDPTPLYALNPLNRFSERAADYVKYRPSYPGVAIDKILEGLESPPQLVAADVGAGTGISSRLLAEREVRVLAIEPNAEMRQAAKPHQLVDLRDVTAEATGLPDASVDLVTCFQSFHWFQPQPTLQEFHRILKPSGRLAVVWNERDRHDEFTATYTRLIQIASNYHPAEQRRVAVEPLLTSPLFPHVQQHIFAYRQNVDLAGLIGRAMSTSYIPRAGAAHQQLVSDLQQLYESNCDRDGLVSLVYSTSVFLAQPRA